MSRVLGVGRLIEEALNRPPHRPIVARHHVADEYAELAAHAGDVNERYLNQSIADELRRGLK